MDISSRLEFVELRVVHLQLLLHRLQLLLPVQGLVSPVRHRLQVGILKCLRIFHEFGLADVREAVVVVPVLVVVHRVNHFFEVFDALLQVAELLDA